MITTRRAAAIVSAVLLAGLALSGCAAGENKAKETSSSAAATTPSAPATTSGISATTSAPAAKPAGTKVAAADLSAVVSDRTHRGLSEGKPYAEYYAADGTVRGKTGEETYTGTWKVAGDELCFTYPEPGVEPTAQCFTVFSKGDAIEWLSSDGTIVETTFVQGNPDNL